jgi:hypothetical protein
VSGATWHAPYLEHLPAEGGAWQADYFW